MSILPKWAVVRVLVVFGAACAATQAMGQPEATIRRIAVLESGSSVEVKITASQPVATQTRVVTAPDRLVIDFPNAVPGGDLRNLAVDRGDVKRIRVALFEARPPVTRVVLDLKAPQPYELFPSGNTVIVRVGEGGGKNVMPTPSPQAVAVSASASGPAEQPKPPPKLEVRFQNGLLSIRTDRATLAKVLLEVRQHTGADIAIPAGAEQELVAARLGPSPAKEVLASLLNGSRFNFILLGSEHDPAALSGVILTPRGSGMTGPAGLLPFVPVAQPAPTQVQPPAESDEETEPDRPDEPR